MISKTVVVHADMTVKALRRWKEAVDKLSPRIVMNIIKGGMLDPEDKATIDWYRAQRAELIKSLNRLVGQMKAEGIEYQIPADIDMSLTHECTIGLNFVGYGGQEEEEEDEYEEPDQEEPGHEDLNDLNA